MVSVDPLLLDLGDHLVQPVVDSGIDQLLVGRDADIEAVVKAVLGGGWARVVIHGPPGVSKDVTAVEAVLDDRIKYDSDLVLQAWLQGSTDETFRRQLVRLFATQYPGVVRGAEDDQAAALAKITRWLREHPGWLFVIEDANFECRSLWTCLSAEVGRVVFTSVEDLRAVQGRSDSDAIGRATLDVTAAVELSPPATADRVELWRLMNLFTLKPAEVDLAMAEADLYNRCTTALTGCGHPDRLTYVAPPANEKPAGKKQRYLPHAADRAARAPRAQRSKARRVPGQAARQPAARRRAQRPHPPRDEAGP